MPACAEQGLHRNGVGFDAEEVVGGAQAFVQAQRRRALALAREVAQSAEGGGQHVGRHRDHAVGAGKHRPAGRRVIAAEHGEAAVAQAQQGVHALAVAACFLDRDDAGVAGQFGDGLRQHVAAGAAGHVVEHDRQGAVVGDRAVMGHQARLRGPDIRRRDDQRGIRAQGAARRDCSMVFAVFDWPVPASTGIRRRCVPPPSAAARRIRCRTAPPLRR
jgi:hypothetical protein